MSRGRRIAAIVGLSVLGLIVLLGIAIFVTVQTDWFRNFVRQKIITTTEEATGGKVDLASFNFDWSRMRATITGFVLHGTEPPTAAPLFQAKSLTIDLKLLSSLKQAVDIRALNVDTPQANVIVNADGSTNVPSPKVKKKSDKSGLQTVVDLAIKRFDLNNGSFTFAMQKMPLDAHGKNLRAQLAYNTLQSTYEGRVSLDPLLVKYETNPINIHAEFPVVLAKDAITLKNAKITTAQSEIVINGAVENMNKPRTSLRANARLLVQEFAKLANLKVSKQPATLNAEVAIVLDKDQIRISTARATLGGTDIEAQGVLKDPSGQGNVQLNGTLALGEIGRLFEVPQRPEGTARLAANLKLLPSNDYQATGNLHATNVSFVQDGTRYRNIGLATAFSANPAEIALNGLKLDAFGGQFSGNADIKQLRAFSLTGKLAHFDLGTLMQTLTGESGGYSGTISGPVTARGDLKNPKDLQADVQLAIAPGSRGVPVSGAIHLVYNGANGNIELSNTRVALPNSALEVSGSIGREMQVKLTTRDLNDFLPALKLKEPLPVKLSGPATFDGVVSGNLADPRIRGRLEAAKFSVEGRAFDRLTADLSASQSGAAIQNAAITRGPMQASLAGNVALRKWKLEPNLPLSANLTIRNGDIADLMALAAQPNNNVSGPITADIQVSGTESRLKARARVNSQFAVAQQPKVDGAADVNLDAGASLVNAKGEFAFQLLSIDGTANVRGLKADNQDYGNLAATFRTSGNTVRYDVNSDLAGSSIRASGDTRLEPDYPTNATANIANLPVDRVLALAGRKDLNVRGTASGSVRFNGTIQQPNGSAEVTLANAVVEDEPLDRVYARVNMTPTAIDVPTLEVRAGPSQIALTANYSHALNDLNNGRVQFRVTNGNLQLDRLRTVQKYRAGLTGAVQIAADGAATVQKQQFLLTSLNASADATNLVLNRARLGDARIKAQTAGDRLTYTVDSDIARAAIHGKGETLLRADYPTTAQLTFDNITYTNVRPLLPSASNPPADWDAKIAGSASISGPIMKMDELQGRVQLTRVEIDSTTRPGEGSKPIQIVNQGPVVFAINKSVVTIESARLTGPQTDIQLKGSAPLKEGAQMDVTVAANTNLGILQQMSRNIYSSGAIVIQAAVRGTFSDPQINGRLDLKDASFNMLDLPNGISNANGAILFNGNTATIQSLTAETGGGKVTAAGMVGFGGGNLSYNLKTNATGVRVRTPQGASVQATANITLTGTTERSVLGGTVTLDQIGFNPQSDFGSMLSRGAEPPRAPSAPSGPLAGMVLDIRIRSSPTVSFATPLAERLQADADLYLRGTLDSPGMTGRINITAGDLVFFGTKYTVNQGAIAFYSPFAIKPILNIDLETVAKGVNVVLTVSGPIENMKLTYRSDPPLQFSEVVALLATGKTPTSDPTLLANQPSQPAQTFQQMGQSALVSQAIANPVSSRLQRVFGVNKLKIDPTFTSGSELPQARVTLQQQITNNVTFTYITNLQQANSQIIRVEWALNDRWSAIATREETGRFGVDFFYKRKFR